MFFGKEKYLIGVGILFAIVFIVIVVATPVFKLQQEKLISPSIVSTLTPVPKNAFLPVEPGENVGINLLPNQQPLAGPAKSAPIPKTQPTTLSLKELEDMVTKSLTPQQVVPQQTGEYLQLPPVADSELNIGTGGVNSADQYLIYFAKNSDKISFDTKKLSSVLKDEYGIFLTAPQLVEKELKEGPSQDLQSSLLVQKEFLAAEISFFKSIRVSGDAIALNKKMIGANDLTISLVDSGLGLANGTMQKDQLQKKYGDYVALISGEHGKLLSELQLLSLEKKLGGFGQFAEFLGVLRIAFAQVEISNLLFENNFGGIVMGVPTPCINGAGYWVTIGLPKPPIGGDIPGAIHITPASQVAALLIIGKNVYTGSCMIGNYIPAFGTLCMLLVPIPDLILGGGFDVPSGKCDIF